MEAISGVYRLSLKFLPDERFGLTPQVRRSAVSIAANIAEGQGRLHRGDFRHHLSIARGSLYETESHLFVAHRLNLIGDELLEDAERQSTNVARLLNGLVRSQRTAD